ncbi:radical SAM protein [Desulfonatronovibrio hydrogenovorans]|uniref:radical SAM protein n=1 Tax=Desulfonatronovibrio hydrogenovorans TaxID=53245 RepID=UPI00048B7FFB|nr:radical SAM protein [Desulfonatronovibrio hydrogenovorans]
MFEFIFGPVWSSRLGSSLGIDLLGSKTCSFDCLYCESGKTEAKTVARKPYVPLEKVEQELTRWFSCDLQIPDHITLGGEGEPCLNSELGTILDIVKKLRPDIPAAVLTNSSLLNDPGVRKELLKADVVLPSLDSMVEEEFLRINRPHPGIKLKQIIQGLMDFRQEFSGKLFLEVLILPGINDSLRNRELLLDFCTVLKPDRVDLTTMTRPGAHIGPDMPDKLFLEAWNRDFRASSKQEVTRASQACITGPAVEQRIRASVQRRPQTMEQLVQALGIHKEEALAALASLESSGKIRALTDQAQSQIFYAEADRS